VIIDSSALVAVAKREEDSATLVGKIVSATVRRISAASYVESAIVVDSKGDPVLSRRLDDFLKSAEVVISPVTERQAHIARDAYRDFGKGSGHPARLNFGDCLAYALAKELNEPLLFKGNDFSKTDVEVA
jgi:ribonuclease VapC